MTIMRAFLVLLAAALVAACGGEASDDDGRLASGEVLEGTISDAMLPIDRVRSEPPLEDPEAFAKARSVAVGAEGADDATEGEDGEEPDAEGYETETPEPAAAPAEG